METPPPYAAVILAGGTSARLGGIDKAGIEHAGRTLLEHVLDAVAGATEVVVVGDSVPTLRPVTFAREDPPRGGPAAGLLAGIGALARRTPYVLVLAVDMPRLTTGTVERLLTTATGHDGACLVDDAGRRQLALALDLSAVERVRPDDAHGLAWHRLTEPLDLVDVPAQGEEARDVDTWEDLVDLGDSEDGGLDNSGDRV